MNFIGRLLLASFRKDYFLSHTFAEITSTQFHQLFGNAQLTFSYINLLNLLLNFLVSAVIVQRFATVQQRFSLRENEVTKNEVARVIRNRITNFRSLNRYPK